MQLTVELCRTQPIQHVHVPKCGGTTIQAFFCRGFLLEEMLWMDRVRDAPKQTRRAMLGQCQGDEIKANRLLISAMGTEYGPLRRRWMRKGYEQEVRKRAQKARLVYVHNPYGYRCLIGGKATRPVVVVRDPWERYVSCLKHMERLTEADMTVAQPHELKLWKQVLTWDVEDLALRQDSLLPLAGETAIYGRIVETIARSGALAIKRLPSGVRREVIARTCLPLPMLGEWLTSIATTYGVDPGLARLRENTAHADSRFDGLSWESAGAQLRAQVCASQDYQVYSDALKHSRVVEETLV